MTTLRDLVITERENFINLVFNLTSQLNDEELEALETYINHGPDFDSLGSQSQNKQIRIKSRSNLFSDYDIKKVMLATNRHHISPEEMKDMIGLTQMTNIPKVDNVINTVDRALLDYEGTVAVAAGEGMDILTKDVEYQWTYVQSVFFTSTIITTVGKRFNLEQLKTLPLTTI